MYFDYDKSYMPARGPLRNIVRKKNVWKTKFTLKEL